MSAPIYPGDLSPRMRKSSDISKGARANVSDIQMCLHNGTHIDAPKHYFDERYDVVSLGTSVFCGICDVVSFDEDITGESIENKVPNDCERLIIKSFGKARLTYYALMELLSTNIKLIGIDDVTIGVDNADDQIHRELLQSGIVILEGLDLEKVPDGRYVIVCEPIKIRGAEAAPCRAILLKDIMLF